MIHGKKKIAYFFSLILVATFITFIMLNFVEYFNIVMSWRIFFICIPFVIIYVIFLCSREEAHNHYYWNKPVVYFINSSLFIANIEYLFLLLIGKTNFSHKVQIVISELMIFSFIPNFLLLYKIQKKNHTADEDKLIRKRHGYFSIFYINIDKVYEIAMLLNNKIAISICKEYESSNADVFDKSATIGAKMISVNTDFKYSHQYQIAEKNKVLENFDVKTTKSNLLNLILENAKTYENVESLKSGDLVIFRNSKLILLNQDETLRINKMLMNGAFNDSRVTSGNDGMNIEMSISALINSILKDCSYELGCDINNEKFSFTIPMTFENDFENSYNIYDLLIGKVTLIGIYRGKDSLHKNRSMLEYFSENSSNNSYKQQGNFNLTSSIKVNSPVNVNEESENINNYERQIDIIAIIQDINSLSE